MSQFAIILCPKRGLNEQYHYNKDRTRHRDGCDHCRQRPWIAVEIHKLHFAWLAMVRIYPVLHDQYMIIEPTMAGKRPKIFTSLL